MEPNPIKPSLPHLCRFLSLLTSFLPSLSSKTSHLSLLRRYQLTQTRKVKPSYPPIYLDAKKSDEVSNTFETFDEANSSIRCGDNRIIKRS
jgi:hypothetical protein